MCQDEWLNESVIPSANENATACVTKRLRGASTESFRNIYHRTTKSDSVTARLKSAIIGKSFYWKGNADKSAERIWNE